MMRQLIAWAFTTILLISGCATAPYVGPVAGVSIPGFYHRVERGETLWRISKAYNVALDEIIRANRIADATNIEIGQNILIPGRQKVAIHSGYTPSDANEDFIWPINGRITLRFNTNSNRGINIEPGSTNNVVASRKGKIIFTSGNLRGLGKTVIIDHGDRISTVYARNEEIFVKVGDFVQKGSIIARLGPMKNDKKIYLHFEVRKDSTAQNPLFYLSS